FLLPSSFFLLPSSFFLLPSSFFLLPSDRFLPSERQAVLTVWVDRRGSRGRSPPASACELHAFPRRSPRLCNCGRTGRRGTRRNNRWRHGFEQHHRPRVRKQQTRTIPASPEQVLLRQFHILHREVPGVAASMPHFSFIGPLENPLNVPSTMKALMPDGSRSFFFCRSVQAKTRKLSARSASE